MKQVTSSKETVTYQKVSVQETYEVPTKVVNIYGQDWYAVSAYIDETWDIAQGTPKNVSATASFVSILKNGKAGNRYKTVNWLSCRSFNGAFKDLFEAFDKEVAVEEAISKILGEKIEVIGVGVSKEDTETIKENIINKITRGESQ